MSDDRYENHPINGDLYDAIEEIVGEYKYPLSYRLQNEWGRTIGRLRFNDLGFSVYMKGSLSDIVFSYTIRGDEIHLHGKEELREWMRNTIFVLDARKRRKAIKYGKGLVRRMEGQLLNLYYFYNKFKDITITVQDGLLLCNSEDLSEIINLKRLSRISIIMNDEQRIRYVAADGCGEAGYDREIRLGRDIPREVLERLSMIIHHNIVGEENE